MTSLDYLEQIYKDAVKDDPELFKFIHAEYEFIEWNVKWTRASTGFARGQFSKATSKHRIFYTDYNTSGFRSNMYRLMKEFYGIDLAASNSREQAQICWEAFIYYITFGNMLNTIYGKLCKDNMILTSKTTNRQYCVGKYGTDYAHVDLGWNEALVLLFSTTRNSDLKIRLEIDLPSIKSFDGLFTVDTMSQPIKFHWRQGGNRLETIKTTTDQLVECIAEAVNNC